MTEKPMTKTEARAFLRRARDGVRWAEQALKRDDLEDLTDALNEIGGASAHVHGYVDSRQPS